MKKILLAIRKKPVVSFFLAFCLSLSLSKLIFELATVRIPIFGFHDIVDIQHINNNFFQDKNLKESYTQQDLAAFLEDLVQQNYWFLSTQELYDYFLANPKLPIPAEHEAQKRVMITFDDGYKSINTYLLPILEKLENKYGQKIKVVLFVNSGFLGVRGTLLDHVTCEDLRSGLAEGFYDIQSHGLHHDNLTKISDRDVDRELQEDQLKLRQCTLDLDKTKTVAAHMAYPFGAVDQRVEQHVAKYYVSGYLYNSRFLKLGWHRNRYRIPRLSVNMEKSVKKLIRLASGGWF